MASSLPIAALLLAALATPDWGASRTALCSPFGDPPAEVQNDLLARFFLKHSPNCWGGTILGPWPDADGTPRYACIYEPVSAGTDNPLPLLVYLHPSLTAADSVRLVTDLTERVDSADLGESKPGFILLAPQGRSTTHYYPPPDDRGLGWDNWYRQLSPEGDVTVGGVTYKENADADAIDHFIAQEIATGKVDRNRIYVTGWSNGASMAILYGLTRTSVAAVGVYSAPNPFRAFGDPCPQTPVKGAPANDRQIQAFNLHSAVLLIHNDCDVAGICPNDELLKDELGSLGLSVDDIIVDYARRQVSGCEAACGTNASGDPTSGRALLVGLANHVRWPSSWTSRMLDFFRKHPLTTPAH